MAAHAVAMVPKEARIRATGVTRTLDQASINRIGLCVLVICAATAVLLCAAIGTPYWYDDGHVHFGLWSSCGSSTHCVTIKRSEFDFHPAKNVDYDVFSTLRGLCLSALGLLVFSAILWILTRIAMEPRLCIVTAAMLLVLCVFTLCAAMAVFASFFLVVKNAPSAYVTTLGYSFVLCAISTALVLVCAVLSTVASCMQKTIISIAI